MTNPIEIQHVNSSSQDAGFDDDKSNQFESTSYGSNCTDLSITSRNVVVADRWTVSGKIGEGSFGEVFKVRDGNTNQCYAIKRENTRTKHSQLKYESTMYDVLSGGVGIPRCYWHGNFDGFECIVMDFLGPNLAQVRQNVSDVELEVAIDLVCQMVSIVEDIHNRGVIVRDIKPDNFLFSSKHQLPETEMIETIDEFGMPVISYKKRTCKEVFTEQWQDQHPKLYAVDFGLACYWRNPNTGKIYPDTKKHTRNKTGTARYASINVHRGRTHSRRDDVESIGYILLDLLMGTLPWTGIHARNSKAGWDRMRQLKVDTFMADLCAGLPNGVLKFIEHPRNLQFGDQPDYEKMRQYLLGALPGGKYADLVKSPFGGDITSTDNYNTIQQEQRLLAERQLQQEQHILDQYNQKRQADTNNHSNEAAIERDDTKHQLFDQSTVSGATKGGKNDEDGYSVATTTKRKGSQSSIQRLLKENMAKTVGWNTYKHDQAPWNPKTNWTNDDFEQATGSKPTRSWGDDNDQELGTWGDSLTTTQPDDQQAILAGSSSWDNDNNVDQGKWNEQPPWAEAQQQDKKKSATAAMTATTCDEQPLWDANNHSTTLPMATVTVSTWGDQPSWNDSHHTAAVPIKQQRGRKKSSNNQKPTWSEQQSSWGARPPWEDAISPLSPHSKKITTEPKRGTGWRTTGQHDKQESSASKYRDQASSSWRTVRTEQQPPPRSRNPKWQKSNGDPPSSTWESKQDHTFGWSTTTANDIDYDNIDQQWNEKANSSWVAAKGDGWQQWKKTT